MFPGEKGFEKMIRKPGEDVSAFLARMEGVEVLLDSDPTNPYESIYIYVRIRDGILNIIRSECEHAPDGGWSHKFVVFDAENTLKLLQILADDRYDLPYALKKYLNVQDGTLKFEKFCEERGIPYKIGYGF